jgi:enamine deaminase RidA (YjgF/YER057c/UK114 family)
MTRTNITSGTIWEDKVGYSRAVKVGNQIFVSGTVAVNEKNEIVGINDAYEQTKFILNKIGTALEKAGSSFNDVVRTRMYVTNISDSEKIGNAHAEVFKNIKPASTMVEVSKLVDPKLLIEIEVDAVIRSSEER